MRLIEPETEAAVLGGILWHNSQYDVAAAMLSESDFGLSSHQEIFRAMRSAIQSGREVDIVLLGAELGPRLPAVGGSAYLASLTEKIMPRTSVESHARRVLELSQLRRIASLGEELASGAFPGSETVESLIEGARTRLEAILCDGAAEKTEVSAYGVQALDRWLAERKRGLSSGLSYGISSLDSRTGGMFPGENTTVGGDPGHGKTSLAIQAILANCPSGNPVFFVSLEMTRDQVLRRLWANISGLSPYLLRHAYASKPEEAERVKAAAGKTMEWPLHIYDKSTIRLEQLAGMLRLGIRKHKVRLFIVDFAQILSVGGRDMRERVSKASDQLTAIAKGEGVHLMLLSQLSRKSHAEWNRPPRLSDLKESGSLEQNAHCVVLIHRPWDEQNGKLSTHPASEGNPGCELIIAKQREGSTSAFPVEFNTHNLTFVG